MEQPLLPTFKDEIPKSFIKRHPDINIAFKECTEGGYGKIFFLKNSENSLFALKLKLKDKGTRCAFQKEAETAFTCEGPVSVSIIDYQFDKSCKESWMLMDYIPCTTLSNMTNILKQRKVPTFRILYGAMKSLENLNKKVLHRDLTPTNIVIDFEFTPHIIDFGEQKKIEKDGVVIPSIATPPHGQENIVPNEAKTLGERFYTTEYDIHSYGYSMVSSFTGAWNRNLEIPDNYEEECGPRLAALFRKCMDDVKSRPKHQEVLKEIKEIAKEELNEEEFKEFERFCAIVDESQNMENRKTFAEFCKDTNIKVKSQECQKKLYIDYLKEESRPFILGTQENCQKLEEMLKKYNIE